MELKTLFKLGAISTALILAGCGGDINLNTGDTVVDGGTTTPDQTTQEKAYSGFATQSTSFVTIDDKEVWELSGTLTPAAVANATGGASGDQIILGDDVVWLLDGPVVVGGDNTDSVELVITPGAKIVGSADAYLAISRGSKIEAVGTKDEPIVFTSLEAAIGQEGEKGQWGGLVLLGNAPVNTCPDLSACDASFEVGDHPYGGANAEDDSGKLKYVRVEFGGFKVNDTQEMNGVSFAAVGSGTEVSYLQVHENGDDGVEFWGGNVSLDHIVLTNNFDDSLDWTNGWQGSAQHVYIRLADENSNRGIEADSNSDAAATPMSRPALANFTIEVANGTNASGDDAEGILLRKGTAVNAYNMLVKGDVDSGECLEVNGDDTVVNANAGDLVMTNSLIDCVEPVKNIKDDAGTVTFDANAWFLGQESNIIGGSVLDGYMPVAGSPALENGAADLSNMDARLDDAEYIGAFDGMTDWTEEWTTDIHEEDDDSGETPVEEQPLAACPAGTTTETVTAGEYKNDDIDLVCTLEGNITHNLTLLNRYNVLYKVDGAVVVGGDNENSATLSVQAGATVFGNGDGYIAVSRGSEIRAQGTADAPITFTSQEDVLEGATGERGQWGGLVLLGNGLTNKCPDANDCDASFEVGSHSYGGNDNTDSSGTLSYVVVKYAGFKVNDTQEMNGISFAAVGSGTQVDHIQVHANGDDGVEFWGGAVNLKYVYLTHNFDDSWDWTNGWTGKAQFIYVTHEDGQANRGIEADSNSPADAAPVSNPTMSNITIMVGEDVENASGDKGEGILLRKNTNATLRNVLVKAAATDSGECLEINTLGTAGYADSGELVMTNTVIDCNEALKDYSDGDEFWDIDQWWEKDTTRVLTSVTVTDGMPAADDAVLIGTGYDMSADDSWFESTDFIGAFDGTNDWRGTWAFIPN